MGRRSAPILPLRIDERGEPMSKQMAGRISAALAVVVAALGLIGGRAEAKGLPTETVTCGEHVTHSLRVANNIADCGETALSIDKDGVILDLGGHRIDGRVRAIRSALSPLTRT